MLEIPIPCRVWPYKGEDKEPCRAWVIDIMPNDRSALVIAHDGAIGVTELHRIVVDKSYVERMPVQHAKPPEVDDVLTRWS